MPGLVVTAAALAIVGLAAAPASESAGGAALASAVPLRLALAVEPGARTPLSPGTEAVVHPGSSFEIEVAAHVDDARLVLVDGRGALVPASGTRQVGATTRFTLVPAAPLSPGSRYVLHLDGATRRELRDQSGRVFAPLGIPILTAGTPPPPEPKRPAKRRRR